MRTLWVLTLTAVMLLATLATPAAASHRPRSHHHKPTVVDLVVKASGAKGFDRNPYDYDILREALKATGLADDLAKAEKITVWAPNDRAFRRLARDLGWKGKGGEKAVFKFVARATGDLLPDVLRYHVTPGKLKARKVLKLAEQRAEVPTLLGETIRLTPRLRLVDKEPDLINPKLREPLDLRARNGVVHTIGRVLIPVDLP